MGKRRIAREPEAKKQKEQLVEDSDSDFDWKDAGADIDEFDVTVKDKSIESSTEEEISESEESQNEEEIQDSEEPGESQENEESEENDSSSDSSEDMGEVQETEELSFVEEKSEADTQFVHPKKSRKEVREEMKQTKAERKDKRTFDFITQAKKLWEKARQDKSQASVTLLFAHIQSKINQVVFKHDASRIIQTILKYGTPLQRKVICREMKDFVLLSRSKYGKFIVSKLLKYGNAEQRQKILKEFEGNVVKCIKHKEAGQVVEEIYSQYCNAKQKRELVAEFYGAEFKLFKTEKSLAEILKEHPEKKDRILEHIFNTLTTVINKGTIHLSIVHRILLDYINHAPNITDLLDFIKDQIVEILHTKEGSQVAIQCISKATAKERKAIIKSFKPFLKKIAMEQYGHQVLVCVAACVDDTVLVCNALFNPLVEMTDLYTDKYGSRVIKYLLDGKLDSHQKTVQSNSIHSKKTSEQRHSEILQTVKPTISQNILNSLDTFLRNEYSMPLAQCLDITKPAIDLLKNNVQGHILSDKVGSTFYKKFALSHAAEMASVIDLQYWALHAPHVLLAMQKSIDLGLDLASLESSNPSKLTQLLIEKCSQK